MLPNDTDLTIFRKNGNIQGYNFAFIDGHYNYHTAQDDLNHLDKNTLAHQGKYLMPLLDYFSNANLNTTQTNEDDVYFSIPFTFISYSFGWVLPMVIIAFVLLLFLIFIGMGKRLLSFQEIGKGFIPFLGSLIVSGLITFLGWKLLLILYPQYNDLLNGFTYNGHDYIATFTLLSLAICFAFYQKYSVRKVTLNHYVAPLFFWILINGLLAFFLKGAGFLIIPVFAGLLMLASFVLTQKSKWILKPLFEHSRLVANCAIYPNVSDRFGIESVVWKHYSHGLDFWFIATCFRFVYAKRNGFCSFVGIGNRLFRQSALLFGL